MSLTSMVEYSSLMCFNQDYTAVPIFLISDFKNLTNLKKGRQDLIIVLGPLAAKWQQILKYA